MKRQTVNLTAHYSLVLGLYWAHYAVLMNYTSVYLLDNGCKDDQNMAWIRTMLGRNYLKKNLRRHQRVIDFSMRLKYHIIPQRIRLRPRSMLLHKNEFFGNGFLPQVMY